MNMEDKYFAVRNLKNDLFKQKDINYSKLGDCKQSETERFNARYVIFPHSSKLL